MLIEATAIGQTLAPVAEKEAAPVAREEGCERGDRGRGEAGEGQVQVQGQGQGGAEEGGREGSSKEEGSEEDLSGEEEVAPKKKGK